MFVYTRKCLKEGQYMIAWCVALRPPETVMEVHNERHFYHKISVNDSQILLKTADSCGSLRNASISRY